MNLQGELSKVDVPSIVELARQMPGVVRIALHSGDEAACIVVEEGQVIHAEYGELKGERAFYAILPLGEGSFDLTSIDTLPRRTITKPWNTLLLEALQYLDEHGLTIGANGTGPLDTDETPTKPAAVEAPPDAEPLALQLATLLETSTTFTGASVVNTEGLVLAAVFPNQEADEELTAAATAALYVLGTRSVSQLKRGHLTRMLIQGREGNIIIMMINQRTIFVGLTPPAISLGMVFAEARTIVQQLNRFLNE